MPGCPQASSIESILAKRCLRTMGGSWVIPSMGYEPGRSKLLAEGNWEEISHKSSSNCHEGATQQLSLPESACVYIHVLYYFPLNKYFTCFTTFHLCGNSFYKAEGPGSLSPTTGLVARIWCSHHHHLAGNPTPAGPGHLRSESDCSVYPLRSNWDPFITELLFLDCVDCFSFVSAFLGSRKISNYWELFKGKHCGRA